MSSSDALVFFGATGDLAHKRIFPALQAMVKRGHLNVPVIGVAKAGWKLDQLRARARDNLETHGGGVELKAPPISAFGEQKSRPNYVRFRRRPDVAIAPGVRSKAPGESMIGQEVELVATQGTGDGSGRWHRPQLEPPRSPS